MLNVMTKPATAREVILSTYDTEILKDIAEHGCQSGCAREHIYYHETEHFYDQHQDEIESYFWEIYGDEYLEHFAKDCASMQRLKNNLTWAFIEAVAQEAIDCEN
jgi:hypothetical protein